MDSTPQTGLIVGKDIRSLQKMIPSDSDDPLTFSLAPLSKLESIAMEAEKGHACNYSF